MESAEYYSRQVGDLRWEVAKFEGSSLPTALYQVTWKPNRWTCDCFAGIYHRGTECKHVRLVKTLHLAKEAS